MASGQVGWRQAAGSVRAVPDGAGVVPRVVRADGGDDADGLLLPLPRSRHGLWWRGNREVLRRQGGVLVLVVCRVVLTLVSVLVLLLLLSVVMVMGGMSLGDTVCVRSRVCFFCCEGIGRYKHDEIFIFCLFFVKWHRARDFFVAKVSKSYLLVSDLEC